MSSTMEVSKNEINFLIASQILNRFLSIGKINQTEHESTAVNTRWPNCSHAETAERNTAGWHGRSVGIKKRCGDASAD